MQIEEHEFYKIYILQIKFMSPWKAKVTTISCLLPFIVYFPLVRTNTHGCAPTRIFWKNSFMLCYIFFIKMLLLLLFIAFIYYICYTYLSNDKSLFGAQSLWQ